MRVVLPVLGSLPEISNRERFDSCIRWSHLYHLSGRVFSARGFTEEPDSSRMTSSNTASRISLTSLAFGLTTEIFIFGWIRRSAKKDDVILDIGCGEPDLFELMANSMFWATTVGLDARLGAFRRYPYAKNWMGIRADFAKKTSFLVPRSFKVVVISEVIEHLTVEEGVLFLRKAHDLLQPGGRLILTAPIMPLTWRPDFLYEEDRRGHITFWSASRLIEQLEDLGFGVFRVYYAATIGSPMRFSDVRREVLRLHGSQIAEQVEQVAEQWPPRLATAIFSSFLGPDGGHIRVIAEKTT